MTACCVIKEKNRALVILPVVAVSAVSVENFVNEDCSSGGQLWFRWQNQISWLKSA